MEFAELPREELVELPDELPGRPEELDEPEEEPEEPPEDGLLDEAPDAVELPELDEPEGRLGGEELDEFAEVLWHSQSIDSLAAAASCGL